MTIEVAASQGRPLPVVAVCGGRHFGKASSEQGRIAAALAQLVTDGRRVQIVAGDATGADTEALRWAASQRLAYAKFYAYWDEEGDVAGPIRNRTLLQQMQPDLLVAFPGGRGTAGMCNEAQRRGIPVVSIR